MKSFQLLLLIGFLLGVQCMRAQGDTLSRIPPVLHNVRQGHISTGAQEANHRHSLSLQWGVYIPTGKGFLNRATTISPGSRMGMARFERGFHRSRDWIYPRSRA